MLCNRVSSNKTRIKTNNKDGLQIAPSGNRVSSNKTRIKTSFGELTQLKDLKCNRVSSNKTRIKTTPLLHKSTPQLKVIE